MKRLIHLHNKSFLIDTDVYEKTASIVSNVVGKKINLVFTDSRHTFATILESSPTIEIPIKSNYYYNEIEYYRSLEHELSHILFGTNNNIFTEVARNFSKIPGDIIYAVVNIVEDYRVDSHWNAIYPGSKRIREEFLKKFPDRHNIEPNNPIDILQLTRIGREDVIIEHGNYDAINLSHQFKKILKTVELGDPRSTIVASIMILNLIKRYIENYEENKNIPDSQDTTSQSGYSRKYNETHGKNKFRIPDFEELQKRRLSELIEETDSPILSKVYITHIGDSSKPNIESCDDMKIDYDKTIKFILDEFSKKGKEMNKSIIDKIREIELKLDPIKGLSLRYKIKNEVFADISYHYLRDWDRSLSLRISKELNKIRRKVKETNSEDGTDIDIDMYIQRLSDRNINTVFLDETDEKGIDVVILLDMSSSMNLKRTSIATRAVLTLWDALDKVSGINCEVYIFNAPPEVDTVYVSKVTKDILRRIRCGYGFTPTDVAIDYVSKRMIVKNNNKILILITDGIPEILYDQNKFNSIVDMKKYIASRTSKIIKQIRNKGIEIFTFFIEPEYSDNTLKSIFGPEHTWTKVDDIDKLPKQLYTFVINKIIKTLQTS